LFISKSRISIRNLPKREFYEKELKELMNVVIEEWLKTKPDVQKSEGHKKKFLKQIKVLRDKEKLTATGESLASGIGFAEFADENLAQFAIRYLNNMELATSKGLIVDYSLEDAR
jgi:RNA recognition motif-containing protein